MSVVGLVVVTWHLQGQAETRVPGRVHFLGHLPDRRQLASLYANADVFVHPNPREPFGIGPLEAMASGLPLVTSNQALAWHCLQLAGRPARLSGFGRLLAA